MSGYGLASEKLQGVQMYVRERVFAYGRQRFQESQPKCPILLPARPHQRCIFIHDTVDTLCGEARDHLRHSRGHAKEDACGTRIDARDTPGLEQNRAQQRHHLEHPEKRGGRIERGDRVSFGGPLPPIELVEVQVQEQHGAACGALVDAVIDSGPKIRARENWTCFPRRLIPCTAREKSKTTLVQTPLTLQHGERGPRRRSHRGEVFPFPFVHGRIPSRGNWVGLSNGIARNREEVSRDLMRNDSKTTGESHESES